MSIRVFLVDDQALVLSAFALVIRSAPDMDVVGTALDGADLLRRVEAARPDVVLMDLRMPEVDGITATASVTARHPEVRVLVLATFDSEDDVVAAVRAGASGYLLKDAEPEALLDAIRRVRAGDAVLAPSATRRLLDRVGPILSSVGPGAPAGYEQLTAREREVLEHLAGGRSNVEIGQELFLSETTVKSHVGQVLGKLGVRDRLQAVVLAYRHGLVPLDPPRGGDLGVPDGPWEGGGAAGPAG